ncbi:hypothetical protein Cantr_05811 [Candida viswanathii]|uniref:Zn(2)-C6 fungal-type domain-containing protein n=1 Tax=Candida viswanathii TaxID=5486 RepID=A0A367XQD8_9ASCO|nr:hypothetical protein Cantr_05811 [Candida viswanathii]
MGNKITRVRTGCWTCKKRHRKCDEAKPVCNNCVRSNRHCEGYEMRLSFEIVLGSASEPKTTGKSKRRVVQNGDAGGKRPRTSTEKTFVFENVKQSTPSQAPPTPSSTSNNAWFEDLETLFTSTVDFGKLAATTPTTTTNNSLITNLFNLESHYDEFVDPSPEDKTQWESKKRTLSAASTPTPGLPQLEDTLPVLSHEEENILLKHFFKRLLPLLDGHPSLPWPDLALKYCDFNVARSCFISLACMHMYECREGGAEYYETGIRYINSTMSHLIAYIDETISKIKHDGGGSSHGLSREEETGKTHASSFVILVLINVGILFLVLEKGKSAMARYFFEVFGTICQDRGFFEAVLVPNDKKRSLCVALSWYDTVAAIVSPDCRLPCSMPEWYGDVRSSISTAKIMGCPGEVFVAMSDVCLLRHEKRNGADLTSPSYTKRYEDIKNRLVNYRDYVRYSSEPGEEPYVNRMKCACCWALAVLVTLNRVMGHRELNGKATSEFISTYGTMNSKSPLVTQMVWPVYAIACECRTDDERTALLIYMETLYETAQMGTLYSLKEVVLKVWERGITQEEYL